MRYRKQDSKDNHVTQSPREKFLEALKAQGIHAKEIGNSQWRSNCPAHDDSGLHLYISEKGGKLLLDCKHGCDFDTICNAVGFKPSSAFRDNDFFNDKPDPQPKKPKTVMRTLPTRMGKADITCWYDYVDANGELLYKVARTTDKAFPQLSPVPLGWVWGMEGQGKILYRLPELIASEYDTVFICEGEKDVDNVRSLGLTATCAPMGAGAKKWLNTCDEHLENKHIAILEDNDDTGKAYARAVAEALLPVAQSVKIISLPDLPEKGDVSDWIEAGGDKAQLLAIVEKTPAFQPVTVADEDEEPIGPADPGEFPEDLLAVPGFIKAVMDYNLANAFKPQPVLALAGAIALQSVLAARKVCDERQNRTNLYLLGVAPSGAGKDFAIRVNRDILFRAGLGKLDGCEDFASDSGLLKAVEVQRNILFQVDEIGRLLKTIGDARNNHLYHIATALMKLYSSAASVFKGKAYADEKRNAEIYQPCVSLYGLTVPDNLYKALTPEALIDGFMSRLLIFEGGSAKRQRKAIEPIPERIIEVAKWWGEKQPGGNMGGEFPQPEVIPYTDEAYKIFDNMADRLDEQSETAESVERALLSRVEEKACRLALVYACSVDHQAPMIDEAAAGWACRLSEYLTAKMLYTSSLWISDGEFDAKQNMVIRILQASGGRMSKSQLCRSKGTRSMTPQDRANVIVNLIEARRIVELRTKTEKKDRVEYILKG